MKEENISVSEKWFENNYLIAHASGGIDDKVYTNSLEAFELNYSKGLKIFEIDMSHTSDGVLVCSHDWDWYWRRVGEPMREEIPTYSDFITNKYYNKYTPLDLNMLFEQAAKYDDVYIMTDFKSPYSYEDTILSIKQIVETAYEYNCPEVLDRFIIQIYHYEFLEWVESVYEFDNYLFTCYAAPFEETIPENLVSFCKENNISVITMPINSINEAWIEITKKNNILIYLHTENDVQKANLLFESGATGLYTDFLTEKDFIRI